MLIWQLIDDSIYDHLASCLNLRKMLAKHTVVSFLRKEVPVCFSGDQGSADVPYWFVPSHFET